jgi:hypothetical protein
MLLGGRTAKLCKSSVNEVALAISNNSKKYSPVNFIGKKRIRSLYKSYIVFVVWYRDACTLTNQSAFGFNSLVQAIPDIPQLNSGHLSKCS